MFIYIDMAVSVLLAPVCAVCFCLCERDIKSVLAN